ncbi:MAG TPA: glycosyltransferase [Candidatus Limnocylindrales bacterium]
MAPSVAVVIPAFNEEARIGATLRAIGAFGRSFGSPMTAVLADDGSSDGTVELAERTAREVDLHLTVLRLPHAGKAGAVRSGMLHAAASTDVEYLLMLDADNEIAVDQLAGVRWAEDPSTIYIGRRVGSVGDRLGVRPRPIRRLMSTGMRTLSRLLLGLTFSDTQCGFKLFPRHLVGGLFGEQRSRGWVFDAEILLIASRSGIPIAEVPLVWTPRGVSRVRPSAAVSSVFELLAIAARNATGAYRPIDRAPAL